METTKISHVAHLVELCANYGISKVVISPGSRNAPLIIAFEAHPQIEIFLVHDERSAAFFALGLAEELNQPVAITCTSGSAAINYASAISEAYYRRIPLLVLTADRPFEMVDQGDGQTIRQKNLFANYIKADFELPSFPSKEMRLISDQIVNQALNSLVSIPQGPVHINIALTEPLYEIQELKSLPIVQREVQKSADLSDTQKEIIEKGWINSTKRLVLIGQLAYNSIDQNVLKGLIDDPSVAILVENTSNIQDFQKICHCIDRTLEIIQPDELTDFIPDLLITFGGAIISKKIKSLFRKHKPTENWRVGQFLFVEDTYQSLTHSFNVTPETFLNYLLSLKNLPTSNFGGRWKQKDFMAKSVHDAYVKSLSFSDFKAYELILDTLPEDTNLHMANSSVVRYCQLFDPILSLRYYANRGVSGIDGSTSTALGVSLANKNRLNVLITGDTSFFYDSNALWNNYLPPNLRIILINNGGGGIFKILEGSNQSKQIDYFVAPFQAKAKSICEAFNVHYLFVDNETDLDAVFEEFYTLTDDLRPCLLEIDTRSVENEKYLKTYFDKIRTFS
jgi:2-succinyl-5-enolpyruvyl-6-hydroxy-3-cyclohexene-1-carboxylate synthase